MICDSRNDLVFNMSGEGRSVLIQCKIRAAAVGERLSTLLVHCPMRRVSLVLGL